MVNFRKIVRAALPLGGQRAEHPNYEPDLNFRKARAGTDVEQAVADLTLCRRDFVRPSA